MQIQKKLGLFLSIVLLGLAAVAAPRARGQESDPYWQITFSYDATGWRVIKAAEIPEIAKEVRTPGLAGAPGTVACDLEWLGADRHKGLPPHHAD